MRTLFAIIVRNLELPEEHSKAQRLNRPQVVGLAPMVVRQTLRDSRRGLAAYGVTMETLPTLDLAVTIGLRPPLPGPMPGSVPWAASGGPSTGTTPPVPVVSQFVASGIKGGA